MTNNDLREAIIKILNQSEDGNHLLAILTFAKYYKEQKEE